MLLSWDAPPPIARPRGGAYIPVFRSRKSSNNSDIHNCINSEFRITRDGRWTIEGITMLDAAMIERGLEKTGKSKGGLAAAMGVRPGAVSEILGGERLVKASEIIPIMEYLELNLAPIMGRVGAGAVIEPDYEQVPPEGLGDIALPFPIMEETIAFEIVGDSMLPKYESGDVIVVYKDQRHPLSSFYGEEAVVRLKPGERYLKTIERGKSPSVVNLSSFNAKQIVGVKLEWVGEICLSMPKGQLERLRAKSARPRKRSK